MPGVQDQIQSAYGGLNRIEVTSAGWKILAWAEVAHLKGALDDLPG